MEKFFSLLALMMLVIGLTGCLDSQDGSGGRPKASAAVSLK